MAVLNYAVDYSKALANAFPYSLYFGCCYTSPNNSTYKWTGADTIKIPTLTTSGRVDSDRDTVATAQRNYNNGWETKVLEFQRKWSTLVHPMDIDQTNYVASISNITKTYNEQSKFPEMDAYCVSKCFADWTALGKTAETTVLDETNVLEVFDKLMENMDNKRVPASGRVLHVTPAVKTLLKNASAITRRITVDGSNDGTISRQVNRLDEVEIVSVPPDLMKTAFDFTTGYAPAVGAKDIKMFLMHPLAVITPVSYQFAQLDEPSAVTEGKYIYFEESFEDVFILNNKADAIQFVTTA
jgi:hypothetical protein